MPIRERQLHRPARRPLRGSSPSSWRRCPPSAANRPSGRPQSSAQPPAKRADETTESLSFHPPALPCPFSRILGIPDDSAAPTIGPAWPATDRTSRPAAYPPPHQLLSGSSRRDRFL